MGQNKYKKIAKKRHKKNINIQKHTELINILCSSDLFIN